MSTVVGVIPRCTIEVGVKSISERRARSDGALLDGWHTIKPGRLLLEDTVPMQRSTIFGAGDLVIHGDLKCIPPVGFQVGSRELAID